MKAKKHFKAGISDGVKETIFGEKMTTPISKLGELHGTTSVFYLKSVTTILICFTIPEKNVLEDISLAKIYQEKVQANFFGAKNLTCIDITNK